MISGDTSVAAFLWYLPAIVHDLRHHLILAAVAVVVLASGAVAGVVLALTAPTEPDGVAVDPARLLPMRHSYRRRRPRRTGAVCLPADNTVEVRR